MTTTRIDRIADSYLQQQHGIRYAPMLVLLMVRLLGPTSQQAIASQLGVSRASVTQRVSALAAAPTGSRSRGGGASCSMSRGPASRTISRVSRQVSTRQRSPRSSTASSPTGWSGCEDGRHGPGRIQRGQCRHGSAGTGVGALSVPYLAVAGEKDTASISRDPIRLLGGAIAPGLHHHWNIENVDLFNAAVRSWIERGEVARGLSSTSPE